jgi:hypothetical protein
MKGNSIAHIGYVTNNEKVSIKGLKGKEENQKKK